MDKLSEKLKELNEKLDGYRDTIKSETASKTDKLIAESVIGFYNRYIDSILLERASKIGTEKCKCGHGKRNHLTGDKLGQCFWAYNCDCVTYVEGR